jgi:hypothetical protein
MKITSICRQPAEIDLKIDAAYNPPVFFTIAGNSPGIYQEHPFRAKLYPYFSGTKFTRVKEPVFTSKSRKNKYSSQAQG